MDLRFPLFSLNHRSVKNILLKHNFTVEDGMIEETVTIRDDRTTLVGFLEIPSTPAGIVLFSMGPGAADLAHVTALWLGSFSREGSRHS
jgi:hypothetical protein